MPTSFPAASFPAASFPAANSLGANSLGANSLGAETDATIYLIDRGWHTEIGIWADPLDARFDALRARFPGARAFTFGFGERLFVQKRDSTPFDMARALLPGDGMVLVTALNTGPEQAFGTHDAVQLAVSPAGFLALEDFVRGSMADSLDGKPVYVGAGPYPGSAFYGSGTTYYGLYTCNTWTADAVRAAGIPITSNSVVFASQVMDQVRWRIAAPR